MMGILELADCAGQDDSRRSLAALDDVLDLQRRLMNAGADMSWLVNRIRSAPAAEQRALGEQLDDLTATLLAIAERMRTLLVEYRLGKSGE
jgi:hypothetical protein